MQIGVGLPRPESIVDLAYHLIFANSHLNGVELKQLLIFGQRRELC